MGIYYAHCPTLKKTISGLRDPKTRFGFNLYPIQNNNQRLKHIMITFWTVYEISWWGIGSRTEAERRPVRDRILWAQKPFQAGSICVHCLLKRNRYSVILHGFYVEHVKLFTNRCERDGSYVYRCQCNVLYQNGSVCIYLWRALIKYKFFKQRSVEISGGWRVLFAVGVQEDLSLLHQIIWSQLKKYNECN